MIAENINLSAWGYVWLLLKTWYWLFIPFILWPVVRSQYLWRVRWEIWYKNEIKWLMLELKPPKENLKPFRAMEDVFTQWWALYDGPNWREQWCEGEPIKGPFWFSCEIVSIEGKIHFYLRIPQDAKDMFEYALYGHFPDVEITPVDDYIKLVPQDLPNQEYDLRGEEYVQKKPAVYPIRTYEQFYEEKPDIAKEEKRIDPIDNLLEGMAKVKKGEHLWFQIVAVPILPSDYPWVKEGQQIVNKIVRRPSKAEPATMRKQLYGLVSGIPGEVGGKIISGTGVDVEERTVDPAIEKSLSPAQTETGEREMLLTPRERFVVAQMEKKMSKRAFKCWIRVVSIYRRDNPSGSYKVIKTYMTRFADEDLNLLIFWGPTRTRIHYWFRKRRLYLRKRSLFKKYLGRWPLLWPRMYGSRTISIFELKKGLDSHCILSTEEIATLFHFPAKIGSMGEAVRPIEAKKSGPPAGLPTG